METPVISVIVLCYNYGRYLAMCLDSILAQQQVHEFEVILINDGSTDNTSEIVKGYLQDKRFRYIHHQQNLGHIYSANEGLAFARGRFILRLDADDYVADTLFAKAVATLQKYPEVGLVHGNYCLVDADAHVTFCAANGIHGGTDFMGNEIERLLFDNFICPPTAILRREAWEEIGFKYDEHTPFGEDWWVWLRVGLRRPFYYLNDVVGYYRVHADNIRRGLLASCKAESSIKYILDHFFAIPGLPASIVRLKRQVYAQQYRRLADIYFGIGLYFDCRRCLRMSIRWNGLFVFNVQWWRRYLLATLPAEVYRYLKAVRKKIV